VSELPNAEQRLLECEERLAKSYGPNLERLKNVRGSTNNESVLLLRSETNPVFSTLAFPSMWG
jgi:hypothetical protein